jgi:methionyl-tRNA formyltransferase
MKGERVKLLGSAVSTGHGAAGVALDDEFTIACGHGAVRLTTLQRAGKGPMAMGDFKRGFPLAKGEKLG